MAWRDERWPPIRSILATTPTGSMVFQVNGRENIPSDRDSNNNNLLIVIDGTWSEAKRMVRDSPFLTQECQSVQFSSEALSIYHALRREPEDHCLSTLEACAQALLLLEPSSDYSYTQKVVDRLHTVLKAHVDAHLANAQRLATSRESAAAAKLYAKNQRKREIEGTMFPDFVPPSTLEPSSDNHASSTTTTTF